jgi:hypothetical protein
MDIYEVDYMDADGEVITIDIEASGVIKTLDKTLLFLDEHGEDQAVFYLKDIINYRKVNK